ncbi:MAG: T9SS type A sorting domain-containing protein [Bacteroidota bacterium]
MRLFATALLVALLAPLAAAQTNVNTGTVVTSIYGNGNLGGDCSGNAPAFIFNGDEGLCGAGFLLGFSAANVIGDAYILNNTTGWTPVSMGTSTEFPYDGLDQGVQAVFQNTANNVSVELNAYYGPSTDFLVYRYTITNTGSTDFPAVYPGLFVDYDVGGAVFADNLAAVDPDANALYVWDPTGASDNYFGAATLGADLTGWRYVIPYPPAAGQPQSDPDLFEGLSMDSTLTNTAADQRIVIGAGPVAIAAGESFNAAFALVAGTDRSDLIANVALADAAVATRGEDSPEARGYALAAPAPNPTRSQAAVSFTLPTAQHVRVAVYDALGRRVATAADRTFGAGESRVALDASTLRSGVYVVRLEAEGARLSQTLSLVR